MGSMPPAAPAAAGSGSGISVTTTSEVKKVLATEAAFSRAHRTTLVGSIIPAFSRSSYTPACNTVLCQPETIEASVDMLM